jgi:acyl carrier protein
MLMAKLIEIKFLTIFQIMIAEKKIKQILRSIKKSIKTNTNIGDQLDSIQFLDLIFKLEQTYKIKISESDIDVTNFKSIKNIEKIINEKIK